jgi:hypothetical protein
MRTQGPSIPRASAFRQLGVLESLEGRLLFANVLVNPAFAAGNSGFTSQYVNGQKSAGGYVVGTNPHVDLGPLYANFADHTPTADGKMFMADGALTSGKTVWQEKVNVTPGETYRFSGWAASIGGGGTDPNPAKLKFSVNGGKIGAIFTVPSSNSQFAFFSGTWEAGSATTATIKIVDQTTAFNGNDFALDDLSFDTIDPDDQISEAVQTATPTNGGTATLTGAIFPARDVDMKAFTVTAGTRLGFDIDKPSGSSLDSYLRLFDSTGKQLAANDDASAPGEGTTLDSYLEYTFPTSGTYYVGVSGDKNQSYNALTGNGDAASPTTGAYSLKVSEIGNGAFSNLVKNPTFSQGNVSFSTQYVNGQKSAGGYVVGTNPHNDFGPLYASFADHTPTSDGKMFEADGALTAGKTAWQENLTITAGKTYRFSGWAASIGGGGTDPNPANLVFTINGQQVGTFTVPSTNSKWVFFSAVWSAGTSTSATIKIVDHTTAFNGNDFALDDLSFARNS